MPRFVTIGICCLLAFPLQNTAQYLLYRTSYQQDFDLLAAAGKGAPATLPPGWFFTEDGPNADTLYRCGDGSDRAGDTYSFGAAGSSERALGSLLSGSLQSVFGFYFVNHTGRRIRQLRISYRGEQWRMGATGRADSLLFEYKMITSLPEDTLWIREPALDLIFSDMTSSGDAGNRYRQLTALLGCLDIRPGEGCRLRWTDADANGYDDGLAIDDLSLEIPGRADSLPPPGDDTIPPPPTVYMVSVRADPPAVAEADTAPAAFYLTLHEPAPPEGLAIYYRITGGSRANDYKGLPAAEDSVLFAAGDTLRILRFFPIDDTLYEGTEYLTCRLLGSDHDNFRIVAPDSARVTVTDDDPVPDIPPPFLIPYDITDSFYAQDFDGLISSSRGNYLSLPGGWYFHEKGSRADHLYTAGNGSSRAGDTYSLGEEDGSDRALGFLQSSSLEPYAYFYFKNATDSVITGIRISYDAEQWRCGRAGRYDSLLFDYSTDTGSVNRQRIALPGASVATPDTAGPAGRRNGNAPLYRRRVTASLDSLYLPPGANCRLRWMDYDAAGADDALAIDDVALQFYFTETDPDTAAVSFIHDIQGRDSFAAAGVYTIRGVVTAIYGETGQQEGFFVQEEPEDADTDTATSEGIFIRTNNIAASGDVVQLTGKVQENGPAPFAGQAVMQPAGSLLILSHDHLLPPPASLYLGADHRLPFEQYEGMLVQFRQVLTVTGNDDLGRFGELTLSSAGLLAQPTDVLDPDDATPGGVSNEDTAQYMQIQTAFARDSNTLLLLDDGSGTAFPDPVPFLDKVTGTLRTGSTVTGLTGVISFAHGQFSLQSLRDPVKGSPQVTFEYNERPSAPPADTTLIRVVSFNMGNCFNGDGQGTGFPASRGAHSAGEWQRQRTKLLSAMVALQADVFGLQELENDGNGTYAAVRELVSGLQEKTGASYAFLIKEDIAGDDLICNAILYKTGRLATVGNMVYEDDAIFERPPLAQTFRTQTGATFTLVVIHLKSKAGGGRGADADRGDGQGAFNDRRKRQAAALTDFISDSLLPSGIHKILCIGDFNSYTEEDPADLLRAAGLVIPGSHTSPLFTYRYHIYTGALDHAAVSPALLPAVYKIQSWPVNSPEPPALDYNDAVSDPPEPEKELRQPSLYRPDAYRSSDHDPLVIDLLLRPESGSLPGNADTSGMPSGDTTQLPDAPAVTALPLQVFPNPASGNMSLRFSLEEPARVTLSLWNSAGKKVYFREGDRAAGTQQLSIPVKDLKGFYILKVRAGKTTGSRKVILR